MTTSMTNVAATLLIALPLLAATPRRATAQDWVAVGSDPTLSVHPPIVSSPDGTTRSAWFRIVRKKELPSGKVSHESVGHYYAVCAQQTLGAGTMVWHDVTGDTIASDDSPAVQKEIVPGSTGEEIFIRLCG